jgi:hypothetical protein
MKGCMDLIHLATKVRKPKVTLAYRLLVAAPVMMTNQSNLCYNKEYTRYGVTREWSDARSFAGFSCTVL